MTRVPHSEPARAKTNRIEIVYEPFGNPDALPLLLIMDLGCQMIDWNVGLIPPIRFRGQSC